MKISDMSVELVDHMGSDLSVVNAARVSFNKISEELSEKDIKLINYLARHNHWTPFGHNSLTFRIKAPIFVARQLVKHQVGGVWNEVSRRYVDDEPEFWFPKEWRGKPENAKQGSTGLADGQGVWHHAAQEATAENLNLYLDMVNSGVAPEQARTILPQNAMTEWVWTGSIAFFARVLKLRLDAHAQQETREVATLIKVAVPDSFKHSLEALVGT